MSATTASFPTRVFKQWDKLALLQLAAAATRLHEENEELARQLSWAEQSAEMWADQAQRMQLDLCELTNSAPGITQNCDLVFVERQQALALELHA